MTPARRRPTRWPLIPVLALLASAGCGDDAPKAKPPPPRRPGGGGAPPPAAAPGAGAADPAISIYTKVPDEYRRKLTEADFIPDPKGEQNRDPFRSWVLRPSLDKKDEDKKGEPVRREDICTKPSVRWGAQGYSVRDLRLVGIVKRGRSYAQFVDKSDKDSWIVRRGDCIGMEKAIVDDISVGLVTLSITPQAPPGAVPPPPQEHHIPLYAEELELDEIEGEEQPAGD